MPCHFQPTKIPYPLNKTFNYETGQINDKIRATFTQKGDQPRSLGQFRTILDRHEMKIAYALTQWQCTCLHTYHLLGRLAVGNVKNSRH